MPHLGAGQGRQRAGGHPHLRPLPEVLLPRPRRAHLPQAKVLSLSLSHLSLRPLSVRGTESSSLHRLSYLSSLLVHGRFLLLCPHNHNQSFHRLGPGIFDLVPNSPIRAPAVGSMLPRDSRHGVAALYTGVQPWPSEFRACPPQLSSTGCLILPDSLFVPRVIYYHYL